MIGIRRILYISGLTQKDFSLIVLLIDSQTDKGAGSFLRMNVSALQSVNLLFFVKILKFKGLELCLRYAGRCTRPSNTLNLVHTVGLNFFRLFSGGYGFSVVLRRVVSKN